MASLTTCLGGHGSWRRFVRTLLQLVVVAAAATTTVVFLPGVHGAATAGDKKISAIFMFGDSIVDPGNNNNRITEAKANFPPYGQDFPGGVATGRFSNGLVPGDFLASKLGIKELLPPFLSDDLELKDLLTGVAFACGGSGYDPLTSKLATTLSSTDQLELFNDYKEKLRALVGEEEMSRVISQGIYFTVMGANDILNNYFTLPLRRHEYDLPSYVDFLVSSAINFTKTLNDMGAKRIGFVGVPPLGCCPSQITLGGSPSRQCEPLRNQASRLFNSRISQEIELLNAERSASGSKLAYLDIYYNLLDLIQNPALYAQHNFVGFKDVTEGCCGSTVLNAAIFIAYHSACPNAIDYIFWDGFHPTEKAYDIVVDKLIQQNMKYLM
ncbi:GDSL esterase/lipase EXL1 [Dichanthelium oligosanthes]|uniref:GDSL esterase/lipase EXL1 n=1 Tax=Dichanthelium oligosanthes TaxID=888268 RepID=A0A1E5V741_9POAL|nr:GDSL esterase/lipase EXL1 [Dichanthelium oligosanthes]